MACVTPAHAARGDGATRQQILRAAFPGATITLEPGRSIDRSWNPRPKIQSFLFQDALAKQPVYRVVGPPWGAIEKCAASNATRADKFANARDVRLESFPWPGAEGSRAVLAVFQYDFRGANPPMSCPSVARISRLVRDHGRWREASNVFLIPTHHSSLQRVELRDLSGNGPRELLIELDSCGAGVAESDLVVYSLSHGKFVQWLNVPVRVVEEGGDSFMQSLDLVKTRREGALRFCFDRRTYARRGRWLARPIETHPCYRRFTGNLAKEGMAGSAR